ncbi:MAG: Asr1405/Asl0597 family protein [Cyanobacteria bacterium P01_G01_bin.54]
MLHPNADTEPCHLIFELSLTGSDRWFMYRRLQELEIPCTCQPHRPLQVHCRSVLDAVQCWSINQWLTQPRLELAQTLESCWQAPCANRTPRSSQ